MDDNHVPQIVTLTSSFNNVDFYQCPRCKARIYSFDVAAKHQTIQSTTGYCSVCDFHYPFASLVRVYKNNRHPYREVVVSRISTVSADDPQQEVPATTCEEPCPSRGLTIQRLNSLIDKGVLSRRWVRFIEDAIILLKKDGVRLDEQD